jgi:hypothetical protein
MAVNSKSADLYIRLPKGKAGVKAELVKIAARNDITLNRLMIWIAESFLESKKVVDFTITLK